MRNGEKETYVFSCIKRFPYHIAETIVVFVVITSSLGMMNALMRISFVFAFLLNDVAAQPRPIEGVEILEMVDFKAGIDAGQCE